MSTFGEEKRREGRSFFKSEFLQEEKCLEKKRTQREYIGVGREDNLLTI